MVNVKDYVRHPQDALDNPISVFTRENVRLSNKGPDYSTFQLEPFFGASIEYLPLLGHLTELKLQAGCKGPTAYRSNMKSYFKDGKDAFMHHYEMSRHAPISDNSSSRQEN